MNYPHRLDHGAHTGCGCYVLRLTPEERFSIRLGAHHIHCPVYRESKDPIDDMNDRIIRESWELRDIDDTNIHAWDKS